jgi:hypothetical protein
MLFFSKKGKEERKENYIKKEKEEQPESFRLPFFGSKTPGDGYGRFFDQYCHSGIQCRKATEQMPGKRVRTKLA